MIIIIIIIMEGQNVFDKAINLDAWSRVGLLSMNVSSCELSDAIKHKIVFDLYSHGLISYNKWHWKPQGILSRAGNFISVFLD